MSLCAVAVNRFTHICYRQIYGHIFTSKNSALMVAVIWSIGVGSSIIGCFIKDAISYIPTIKTCCLNHLGNIPFTLYTFVLIIGIPTVIVYICYARIYVVIRASASRIQSHEAGGSTTGTSATNTSINQRTRQILAVFLVSVLFTVFWGLYTVIAVIEMVGFKLNSNIVKTATWLGFSNSCINSIIYGIVNRHYRRAYKKIFLFLICRGRTVSTEPSVTQYPNASLTVPVSFSVQTPGPSRKR